LLLGLVSLRKVEAVENLRLEEGTVVVVAGGPSVGLDMAIVQYSFVPCMEGGTTAGLV
jgi:hypothetical protein